MQVSLWEAETFYAPQDFIIAGAGLAGLWTALELVQKFPAAKILILEKGLIPTGASTRNAGFACFGSPTEMISDAATMGEDAMWSVVEMRYKGIRKIRQYLNDETIDYDPCGGYECYGENDKNQQKVNDQLGWLNNGMQSITGKKNVFKWVHQNLQEFRFSRFGGMIENEFEGGLHSGKLVQALQQLVISKGVKIQFGTSIETWEKSGSGVTIFAGTRSYQCAALVFTVNAFLPRMITNDFVTPARGQIIVTEPIPGLAMKGTFHFDEGYYYFRNVGDRILLGGARNTNFASEATDELDVTDQIQQKLIDFIATHLLQGKSFNITHRWSGIMGFTKNKLPQVIELDTNVFAMTACNGMGVALTPIMAEKLVQKVAATF